MPGRKPRKPDRTPQDPGAIFDAALARGLRLPDGLPPAVARRYYVEHPPTEWTREDHRAWIASFGEAWEQRQDDPHWKAMRAKIKIALGGQPFAKLERMPVRCARSELRTKIIEALADALDALRIDRDGRAELEAARKFAERDLQSALDRKGQHPEPWKQIIQDRETKARQALADVRRMQTSRRSLKAAQKIADG